MSGRSELSHIIIVGSFVLAACLIALFALEPDLAGKATTGTTARIVNSTPANCTFDVAQGYNLVSLPCLSTATPIDYVVGNATVGAMYQYVPGSTDRWRVYNPNLPSYVVSDLEMLTRRSGYVVLMNGSANRTIEGIRVYSTDVPLLPGWNLVGYPSFAVRNASVSFSPINASMTQAVTYDPATASFQYYPGDLNETRPGRGYWINATGAASWTVMP